MTAAVDRLAGSVLGVLVLVALSALTVVLAAQPAVCVLTGILTLLLAAAAVRAGRRRPGPVLTAIPVVAVLADTLSLRAHGEATVWVALTTGLAVAVGLAQQPLHQRVVQRVRAMNLPGIPGDARAEEPGALTPVVPVTATLLSLMLIAAPLGDLPAAAGVVVLLLVLGATLACGARLRAAVRARRDGSINAAITRALEQYAPQFFVYFSGPVDGDYQVRMWLPYLQQLDVPFAVLARNPKMLPRAAALTDAPVIACPRVTGLDDCMVPSVRALFYVNIHGECADGVRYLDRTHVHLNHGDSDKPSSYHPIFAMFDRDFVAGRAAIDRFARHGVRMPQEKFVVVGRPQVAGVSEDNTDPLPGRRTVLYAPTWQSGMREMSLSSIEHGERIVQALLDAGARVVFRPHPLSHGQRRLAATISRIDALLEAATSPQCPHLTSAQALGEGIIDNFNRSDAMVADVSSVPADYLASCKPFAIVLPATDGAAAGVEEFPLLRAAYPLDLAGDLRHGLDAVLGAGPDPLAPLRRELRSYYLGDQPDSVRAFLDAASEALRG